MESQTAPLATRSVVCSSARPSPTTRRSSSSLGLVPYTSRFGIISLTFGAWYCLPPSIDAVRASPLAAHRHRCRRPRRCSQTRSMQSRAEHVIHGLQHANLHSHGGLDHFRRSRCPSRRRSCSAPAWTGAMVELAPAAPCGCTAASVLHRWLLAVYHPLASYGFAAAGFLRCVAGTQRHECRVRPAARATHRSSVFSLTKASVTYQGLWAAASCAFASGALQG